VDCRALAAVVSGSLIACQPPEPFELPDELVDIDIVSELVDVSIGDGVELCAGDVSAMDAHVREVSELLGVPTDGDRIHAVWALQEDVYELCPSGGCAQGSVAIAATHQVMLHELGHAVADTLGRVPPLWAEGLAVALEPRGIARGDDHPALMLALDAEDLEYDQAGSFVRWLWHEYSAQHVVTLYRRSSFRDDADAGARIFEDVFGESLVAAGDRFLAEAPLYTPSLRPRQLPLPWTGDVWQHEFTLRCDDPGVRSDLMRSLRMLPVEVEIAGHYELAVSAALADLRAADGHPLEYTSPPTSNFPRRLVLEAGDYEVDLVPHGLVDAESPSAVFVVQLRPDLDAVPTVPD
jgi:hypothetical protein